VAVIVQNLVVVALALALLVESLVFESQNDLFVEEEEEEEITIGA
jgi:hypothetical protein